MNKLVDLHQFYRDLSYCMARAFVMLKVPLVSRTVNYHTAEELDYPIPAGPVVKVTVEFVSESEIDPASGDVEQ